MNGGGYILNKNTLCSREKVYLKVNSDFDTTGYMLPKTITWTNGQTYKIEEVKEFRPADTVLASCSGDCYTVVIQGRIHHLFFERTNPNFRSLVGRWYVFI